MRSAVSTKLPYIPRPRVVVVGEPPPVLETPHEHVDPGRLDEAGPWSARDVLVLRADDALAHDETLASLAGLPVADRPRVVVSGRGAADALQPLIERHGVVHVVGTIGPAAGRDLTVTIEKLMSNEVFGLDRYLGADLSPARLVCRSSSRRDEVLEWFRAFALDHRIKSRVIDLMMVVADEMFTNAFYNAPVDAAGTRLYADLPRTSKVALDEPVAIELELRCDGQRLGIAVVDPFGSLTPEVVLASLRRCFHRATPRGGAGGAGLGLYLLLTSLSSVVFNVAPGRRTEVIGLIDVSGTYRQSIAAGKSFNLFVEDAR